MLTSFDPNSIPLSTERQPLRKIILEINYVDTATHNRANVTVLVIVGNIKLYPMLYFQTGGRVEIN